jgi:hypothetical protein
VLASQSAKLTHSAASTIEFNGSGSISLRFIADSSGYAGSIRRAGFSALAVTSAFNFG